MYHEGGDSKEGSSSIKETSQGQDNQLNVEVTPRLSPGKNSTEEPIHPLTQQVLSHGPSRGLNIEKDDDNQLVPPETTKIPSTNILSSGGGNLGGDPSFTPIDPLIGETGSKNSHDQSPPISQLENTTESRGLVVLNKTIAIKVTPDQIINPPNIESLKNLDFDVFFQIVEKGSIKLQPAKIYMDEHLINSLTRVLLEIEPRNCHRHLIESKKITAQELMDGVLSKIGDDVEYGEIILKRGMESLALIRDMNKGKILTMDMEGGTQAETIQCATSKPVGNVNLGEGTSKGCSSTSAMQTNDKDEENEIKILRVEKVNTHKPSGMKQSGKKLKDEQILLGSEVDLQKKLFQTYYNNLNPDSKKKPQPIPSHDLMSFTGIMYEMAKGDLKEEFGSAEVMISFMVFIGNIVRNYSSPNSSRVLWTDPVWGLFSPKDDTERTQIAVKKQMEILLSDPNLAPNALHNSSLKKDIIKAWSNAIFQDHKVERISKEKVKTSKLAVSKKGGKSVISDAKKIKEENEIVKTRNNNIKYKRLNFVTFWILERLFKSKMFSRKSIGPKGEGYHPFWPGETTSLILEELDSNLYDAYTRSNITENFRVPQEFVQFFEKAVEDKEWPIACNWLKENWKYIYNFKKDMLNSIAAGEKRSFRKIYAVTKTELELKLKFDYNSDDEDPREVAKDEKPKEKVPKSNVTKKVAKNTDSKQSIPPSAPIKAPMKVEDSEEDEDEEKEGEGGEEEEEKEEVIVQREKKLATSKSVNEMKGKPKAQMARTGKGRQSQKKGGLDTGSKEKAAPKLTLKKPSRPSLNKAGSTKNTKPKKRIKEDSSEDDIAKRPVKKTFYKDLSTESDDDDDFVEYKRVKKEVVSDEGEAVKEELESEDDIPENNESEMGDAEDESEKDEEDIEDEDEEI